MHKARLVKKDTLQQEQQPKARKPKRQRKQPVQLARPAVEVTKEWLHGRREERPSAREAFAALFGKPDPQSA